jgi:hypothetical protein
MLHHLDQKRSNHYHGMLDCVGEDLGLLEGFDNEDLGRDEGFRVGRDEGFRVVLFELQQCPCFESFGFGTPHDAGLESWNFLDFGFLTCVGPGRNASCFCRPA